MPRKKEKKTFVGMTARTLCRYLGRYEQGEVGRITEEYPCNGKYRFAVNLPCVRNPTYDPLHKGVNNPMLGDFLIYQMPMIRREYFFYDNEVEVLVEQVE